MRAFLRARALHRRARLEAWTRRTALTASPGCTWPAVQCRVRGAEALALEEPSFASESRSADGCRLRLPRRERCLSRGEGEREPRRDCQRRSVPSLIVAKRTDDLLHQIEAGALDSTKPLADTLRKVIALGGRAGSPEMTRWASKELNGYEVSEGLPPYRELRAALQVDAALPFAGHIRGQNISPLQLPDFVQEKLPSAVEMRQGIAELERMARMPEKEHLKFQSQLMQDAIPIINAEHHFDGDIVTMYWSVSPTSVAGIVDKVRTALTTLVAEIMANSPSGASVPSPDVASHAVQVAMTGRGHQVTVINAAEGASVVQASEGDRPWWRKPWAIAGGILTVITAVLTFMQVQGWQFG